MSATHHCHAIGCSRSCKPKMFACFAHWRLIPSPLQMMLWSVYREDQEDDKSVSRIYLLVQSRCRMAIAAAEGIDSSDAMRTIRELAAASQRQSLHEAIKDLPDLEALVALDAGLPALVRTHLERQKLEKLPPCEECGTLDGLKRYDGRCAPCADRHERRVPS